MTSEPVFAYTDASRGRPSDGLAGVGICLADSRGEFLAVRWPMSRALTPQDLEWRGILYALEIASEMGLRDLTVYSDSESQIARLNLPDEALTCPRAVALRRQFATLIGVWISREVHLRAHGLSRSAAGMCTVAVTVREGWACLP